MFLHFCHEFLHPLFKANSFRFVQWVPMCLNEIEKREMEVMIISPDDRSWTYWAIQFSFIENPSQISDPSLSVAEVKFRFCCVFDCFFNWVVIILLCWDGGDDFFPRWSTLIILSLFKFSLWESKPVLWSIYSMVLIISWFYIANSFAYQQIVQVKCKVTQIGLNSAWNFQQSVFLCVCKRRIYRTDSVLSLHIEIGGFLLKLNGNSFNLCDVCLGWVISLLFEIVLCMYFLK